MVDLPQEDALTGSCAIDRCDVLARLRVETDASHASVEASLDLLTEVLARERLHSVLVHLYGFHAAAEASIDRWAGGHPTRAEVQWLDWPARRKAHLVAADLVALGTDPGEVAALPRMTALAPLGTAAAAYGRLYVVEGSTLGGQVIARRLRAVGGGLPVDLPSFTPYGAATGRRWHAFRSGLRSWVGDDRARADAVVAAARADFAALAVWCSPLAARSVT